MSRVCRWDGRLVARESKSSGLGRREVVVSTQGAYGGCLVRLSGISIPSPPLSPRRSLHMAVLAGHGRSPPTSSSLTLPSPVQARAGQGTRARARRRTAKRYLDPAPSRHSGRDPGLSTPEVPHSMVLRRPKTGPAFVRFGFRSSPLYLNLEVGIVMVQGEVEVDFLPRGVSLLGGALVSPTWAQPT